MKIKLLFVFFLALTTILATSCYSSRKSGCPMNPSPTSHRYR